MAQMPFLKASSLAFGIEEIFDGDLVVIVETALGGDVLAPIIWVALEYDALARRDVRHGVRAAADHRFQRGPVEGFLVESVLRYDWRHRDNQRSLAVSLVIEYKAHAVVADFFEFCDHARTGVVGWSAFLGKDVVSEQHVFRSHRLAIRPLGPRIEVEFDALALWIHIGSVGKQAVKTEGFIVIALHQRLEDQIAEDLIDYAACGRAQAFQDERVEIVEAANDAIGDAAALRRIGIDVVEMRIIGGQRGLALHGDRVFRLRQSWLKRKGNRRDRGDQPNKNAAHDRLLTGSA